MKKFICYAMKCGSKIETLQRVTEEDLIKGKVDVYNWSLNQKGSKLVKVMREKPFTTMKSNYTHRQGYGYMYGMFQKVTTVGVKNEYILIYGYEIGSLENAKKILLNECEKDEALKRHISFAKPKINKQEIAKYFLSDGRWNTIPRTDDEYRTEEYSEEEIDEMCEAEEDAISDDYFYMIKEEENKAEEYFIKKGFEPEGLWDEINDYVASEDFIRDRDKYKRKLSKKNGGK